MIRTASHAASSDQRSLATRLVPQLEAECRSRLGEVVWFKADWQRGGAATGTSTLKLDDGRKVDVLLKLPVVQRELTWTRRLQDDSDDHLVVPRLYASGPTLGDYDLAWILIERFEHGPLGLRWHTGHVPRIADAAARFYLAASRFPVDQQPRTEPWDDEVREALRNIKVNNVARRQRWATALKTLVRKLDGLVEHWRARPSDEWIHGDLHLANAMSRTSADDGEVELIDLADVRPGHWVEDGVYLERQLWARPERLHEHEPVKEIARARKQHGLPVDPEYPRLAMTRRALLAGTAPKFMKSEGHPRHLQACLDRLEAALQTLK